MFKTSTPIEFPECRPASADPLRFWPFIPHATVNTVNASNSVFVNACMPTIGGSACVVDENCSLPFY